MLATSFSKSVTPICTDKLVLGNANWKQAFQREMNKIHKKIKKKEERIIKEKKRKKKNDEVIRR